MSGVFAKLLENDRQVAQVTGAFEAMIARSLETHPMRHATHAEVKRRFEICASIFVRLRGELRWGIARTLDRMPAYFEAELDGSAWTPDERASWMPEDGREIT
jgi:hypothetical protein